MKEEIKTIAGYTLELDEDSISIKFDKKENKTLAELKQKLINDLYESEYLDCECKIDLLKFLLTIEKD